ncbi:MAG: hypothetical protein ISS71_10165 [Phycisphaerae bacterium]|nr:hypothetical protein [Phycisphaerae bacterium]
MGNVFENVWLLLTVAGIALVVVSVIRQAKPEWRYWPLLVPLGIVGLAFALDAMVKTDTEALRQIITTSKQAVMNNDVQMLMAFVSPNYADRSRLNKAALEKEAKQVLRTASIKKIKTQSHRLTINALTAQSQLNIVVHFNDDSRYATMGTLVFVGMELNYEKLGKNWFIRSVEVISINNQPWNW